MYESVEWKLTVLNGGIFEKLAKLLVLRAMHVTSFPSLWTDEADGKFKVPKFVILGESSTNF
jgi:hypothetical protein